MAKRILSLVLLSVIVFSFAACGKDKGLIANLYNGDDIFIEDESMGENKNKSFGKDDLYFKALEIIKAEESTRADPYANNVIVYFRKEYNEKFDLKWFALEDFGLENASDIFYLSFGDGTRIVLVRLIKADKKHIDDAVKHLSKLDFAERVYPPDQRPGINFSDAKKPSGPETSHVLVYISKDYNYRIVNRNFTLKDFALENAKDFFYVYSGGEFKFISVRLIKQGGRYVQEAIEKLNQLGFVERASMSGNARFGNGAESKDYIKG